MDGHYFISYSGVDGVDFALALADKLEAGPPSYRAWLDQREMRPGQQDWDDQLVEAIRTCSGLLFVMSEDSVRVGSGCKQEWVRALKYKKPVIPLRLHADAESPFLLGSRQFVDFSQSFSSGLARLRDYLRWTGTPEGVLQELRNQLADAERELVRADDAQRPRIEQDVEQLRRRIEEQQRLVDDPQAAREQTERRIQTGLQREREPERREVAPARAKFVNPPPMTAPSYFQDRHVETGLIADFLRSPELRLMSVVGRGGLGKTAMVCRLLKALEGGALPDDLGELAVDGIVYLSPLGGHAINFPNLFGDLCRLLPTDVADELLTAYRDPHETPAALMRALLEAFPDGRTVVLLDNFEDLVDTAGVGLTDAALDEALKTVLTAPAHGVKFILTTRIAPQSLMLVQPAVQDRLDLDAGLPSPHAETLLRARDPTGRLGLKDAPDPLLAEARARTRGVPRALEALAGILAADRNTTLPELLAETARMPENVVEALVGEGFNRLDVLAQQVMQALAIYTVPVPPVGVDYLLQPYLPAIDSAPVLGRLVNMQFVRRDAGRYYLHQVDRDYALQRVPMGEPSDRFGEPPPFSQCALREHAAEYFQQARTPRETWKTLEDLDPQLAEFELRCQAGDFDAAAGVLLEIGHDYLRKWGHVRLTRDLHERVQGRLTDPWTNAANLTDLGNAYNLLGDARRAIELHEKALAIHLEIGDRSGEGVNLANLGNAYNALGDARHAIELHEKALAIFRELGERDAEADILANLGTAYSSLGEPRRAIEFHEQALAIHRELGERAGEGGDLTNLGSAYAALGETRRAIEFHHQALAIHREVGERGGEGADLANLGVAFRELGETRRAIEFYEQALAIRREIADRRGEGIDLANLGEAHADLAEVRPAIELHEQALAIFRETGRRDHEGLVLGMLAQDYADLAHWPQAIACGEEAVRVADETGLAQGSSEGRVLLAIAYLHAGEYGLARATAEAARAYDYAPMRDNVSLVLGIASTREGRLEEARDAFHDALNAADALLAQTTDTYDELDSRALALCGLALLGDPARIGEAIEAFRAARAITRAEGTVARVVRLFDALSMSDEAGVLAPVRPAATGEDLARR